MSVKEGDTIKSVGNHCYKGREGVVDRVEDIDGVEYVHADLGGTKIIMRPGQYKVVKHAEEHAPDDRLSPEIIAHVRRVGNNTRYSITTRRKVLENVQAEIQTLLTMLDYEKDTLDHEQEQAILHG